MNVNSEQIENLEVEESAVDELEIEEYTPDKLRALLELYMIEAESGVDIFNKIVYISGDINDNTLETIIKRVNILSHFNYNNEPITLQINSYGGDAYEAMGIIDYLESLPFKVNSRCYGKSMSAGALILISVTGERSVSRHTTLMLHEISGESTGSSSQIKSRTQHLTILESSTVDILVQHSKKTKSFWKSKLSPDLYLSATDALRYGLIDKII